MNYYLGLDAGGSKTLAVITDEKGLLLASGNSGPGNHQINVELAERNIQEAVNQALSQAGLQPHEIAVAWFGLAGADREADFQILRPMIQRLQFPRYSIVCDTMIALRAGTTRPSGVVVICGTGMNCAGVNSLGDTLQCGGFGYPYGDFGGGSELAVEAFRAVIRAWEGRGQATLLTPLVLEALGYTSVEQMFHHSLDHHREIPSSLTKLLFKAATKGDPVSLNILQKQGTELGLSARAVIEKLGMHADTFDLVLAGSVITKGEGSYIHPYIAKEVFRVAPECSLQVLTVEPVVGAILSAMENDGLLISDKIYEQVRSINNLKGVVTVE
ncbi:N-acetylglucosamine kinase [Paenibacillus sp. Soil724D2]|uniref:N-acetylglucosamine kinase n=1 Tax=Paenibacillus sp. (strain Soil724D2) TaxID=1736392 RepID=UPI0007142426|nr:BadF/BadG/BcrA/BcrD ATPase family protein [Paenibacillus sp. Soil724D2]KRE49752.1 ATPase [Paenibacillus sp. Soil724D2]